MVRILLDLGILAAIAFVLVLLAWAFTDGTWSWNNVLWWFALPALVMAGCAPFQVMLTGFLEWAYRSRARDQAFAVVGALVTTVHVKGRSWSQWTRKVTFTRTDTGTRLATHGIEVEIQAKLSPKQMERLARLAARP